MFEFINKELTEARMFRNERILKGKTAEELSETLYVCILILQIMRYEDPAWAAEYARRTVQYGNFNGMRMSATDTYNLVSILENQERYSDHFQPNLRINVPSLQFKRYLRDIMQERDNLAFDRQFFLVLERQLKITTPWLRSARRIVSQWPRSLNKEKKMAATRITLHLRSGYVLMDLFKPFTNMVKEKGMFADEVEQAKKGVPLAAKVGAAAVGGYALARKMK